MYVSVCVCVFLSDTIWWYSPLIGCLPTSPSCQHYFVLGNESFCYGVLCLLSVSKWIWPLISDYQVMAPLYIERPLSKHFQNHQSMLSIYILCITRFWSNVQKTSFTKHNKSKRYEYGKNDSPKRREEKRKEKNTHILTRKTKKEIQMWFRVSDCGRETVKFTRIHRENLHRHINTFDSLKLKCKTSKRTNEKDCKENANQNNVFIENIQQDWRIWYGKIKSIAPRWWNAFFFHPALNIKWRMLAENLEKLLSTHRSI